MRKRRRNKERYRSGRRIRALETVTALRACLVTWVVLLTGFGLISVEERAVLAGYIDEARLLSVRREEPFLTEICLLGDWYRIDWAPLNQAAEWTAPYFALIPAPIRLPCQLALYGEERYEAYRKEQRKQEFIENI